MQQEDKIRELQIFAQQIRVETIRALATLGFGHTGGTMSVAEALAVLYGGIMKIDPQNPGWEERDWCVMSKGHAGPAVYAALGLKGFFPLENIYTLNQPHTDFPSHTDRLKTPGVDMTTGSLGQGISAAVGIAYANRLDGRDNHVFVILGDGECDEGQVWESAQFAAHYGLDRLICLVDNNKRQLDGLCSEVMSHGEGIGAKFRACGWDVAEVRDGNDVEQVYEAVDRAYHNVGKPACIILNTVKGKGLPLAEQTGAHFSSFSAEQWHETLAFAQDELERLTAQA